MYSEYGRALLRERNICSNLSSSRALRIYMYMKNAPRLEGERIWAKLMQSETSAYNVRRMADALFPPGEQELGSVAQCDLLSMESSLCFVYGVSECPEHRAEEPR